MWINQAFEDLLGFGVDQIIGKSPEIFIDSSEIDLFNQRVDYWLDGKEVFSHFETIMSTNAGRKINVDLSAKKIDFDDQEALLMVVRDVTSRKRLEKDLRKLKDGLEGEVEKKGYRA